MKKFNKNIIAGKTKVKILDDNKWYLVKEVHDTRNWVKVEGFGGSFQRVDILKYSNAN